MEGLGISKFRVLGSLKSIGRCRGKEASYDKDNFSWGT